ncbi:MAG: hypothetical protein U0793_06645 [Gemmataceae bacterium]
MGAWGHGIRQDDLVCDVVAAFEDLLKAGQSVADATSAVQSRFAAAIEDADDGPLFWVALADAQWTYGALDAPILARVQEDFASGRSLSRWSEDPRALSRRKAALEKFIARIAEPNPRPRKPPRLVIRAPRFRPGDCLSIRLSNGQYAAALVLVADHSNPEYGKNLIGVLDYLSPQKPTLDVFRRRKWLVRSGHGWSKTELAWYMPVRFRAIKDRLDVVGQIEVLDSDPKDSDTYCGGWARLGEQVLTRGE